jgi:hypothetical protein
MDLNLNDHVRITRVMNAVAAGTSDQNGSSVDMLGYEGVIFIALLGTLTATQVTSMFAQQSADDSTFASLAGTNVGPAADGDGNKCLVLDVCKPNKRYVRPVIDRGTANAVIDGVIAIQYRARKQPTAHATSVAFAEAHFSPAEGSV